MENNPKSKSVPALKRLGLLGFSLCALCCALPLVGTVLGIGTLSVVAAMFEKAGMIILIIIAGLFFLRFLKARKTTTAPACDNDCNCKSDQNPA